LDAETIYDVPNLMFYEGLDKVVLKKLNLCDNDQPKLVAWNKFLDKHKSPKNKIKIGLIGKYVELHDAYKSISEAFVHAGAHNEVKVKIQWIHSEDLTIENVPRKLSGLDGILVAPGFGNRGTEGKIDAVRFARENNIPFFGICLGMQMAVIEYARNVLNIKDASSLEFDEKCEQPVINLMEDQKEVTDMGGTMRLGSWDCSIEKNSKAYKAYGSELIGERHRHRYEFNDAYRKQMTEAGLKITGTNPKTGLVEIIEVAEHPWFVAVQFHPEYKSTVQNPHPLFVDFVNAALEFNLNK
jgi:CTP synthase